MAGGGWDEDLEEDSEAKPPTFGLCREGEPVWEGEKKYGGYSCPSGTKSYKGIYSGIGSYKIDPQRLKVKAWPTYGLVINFPYFKILKK